MTGLEMVSAVVPTGMGRGRSAEPTGVYFDRAGKIMYIHVQHAGGPLANDLFVAITRDKPGR